MVAANVSGRTLADLVLGRQTDLVDLPWVGHRSPKWEPEPMRFAASRAIVSVLGSADRYEDSDGQARPPHGDCGAVHATPLEALR